MVVGDRALGSVRQPGVSDSRHDLDGPFAGASQCHHPRHAVLGGDLRCPDLESTHSSHHAAAGHSTAFGHCDLHGHGDVWLGDVDRKLGVRAAGADPTIIDKGGSQNCLATPSCALTGATPQKLAQRAFETSSKNSECTIRTAMLGYAHAMASNAVKFTQAIEARR